MPEKVAPKMITINLYGKRYRVPDNMTMLKALEYCGYAPTRGIGCRPPSPTSRWRSRPITSMRSSPPRT